MKKKIIFLLSFFHLLIQDNIIVDSFFKNYINLKSAKFSFRMLTTQNNEIKFQNNGELIIKNDSYKISTNDITYFLNNGLLYSIIKEDSEIYIYDLASDEISNNNLLIKSINIKKLILYLKNNYAYTLTKNGDNKDEYSLYFSHDSNPDYEIVFMPNLDINSVRIINKNSTFNNVLFIEKLKTNIEINSDKLKIDLDNYKDYFINRLWRF